MAKQASKRQMKQGQALPEDAKDFAIACFAKFLTPTQVAEAVNARFGTSIDKRQAQRYDPTSVYGSKSCGKKRKALFELVRKAFLEEINAIPIANKAVRLQQLQAHYDKLVGAQNVNIGMAVKLLEVASKEAEGFHSNEKHVHHSGKVKIEEVTDDEVRNSLAAAIATALHEERERLSPGTETRQ